MIDLFLFSFFAIWIFNVCYLTIRPVAQKGYGLIAHEANTVW